MLSDRFYGRCLQTAFRAVESFSALAFTLGTLNKSDCIALTLIMYFIQEDETVSGCLSVTGHFGCHTSNLAWFYPYFSSQSI